jgi:cobalt-zinc-cadmium efflux system protein
LSAHSHNHGSNGPAGPNGHSHSGQNAARLKIALALTFAYMLAEAFGGWLTGSLALLADAGHMLTDVAAIILTLTAFWLAARPASARKTYGYYRLEILTALINGVTLVVIALWIFYEAYMRFAAPPPVKSGEMILIATGGLIINLIGAWLLHGSHQDNLNMRGAWLHIMGDLLGSVAAIAAGIFMYAFGWYQADPLTSVLIGLIIIYGSWKLIRESVNVLLEGTPAHIDLAAVEDAIIKTEGVDNVHDLHIWTITSGMEALSAHVIHGQEIKQVELLKKLRAKLHDDFGIDHLTIQMETVEFEDEKVHFCQVGASCFQSDIRTSIPKVL